MRTAPGSSRAPDDFVPAEGAGVKVASRSLRGDIEGLRALSLITILVYHAGVTFMPGAFSSVDLFFVISGYLITGQLVKEVERTGRVSLVKFYARRMKRLIPAASTVIVATGLLTVLFLPVTRWKSIGGDLIASATYVINWRLAGDAVDYLATDDPESPMQHFWTLAIEEQFYFIWPILLAAIIFVMRGRLTRIRTTFFIALLALIVLPSFITSVIWSSSNPAYAFFATPTRLWELGVGALIAIAVPLTDRIPRLVAIVLGWAGLGAILGGFFFWIDVDDPWPGSLALIPVLGTAAVIAAGHAAGKYGPALLIDNPPMRWLGGLSYPIYLWHWPPLVVADVLADGLTVWQGLAVVTVSILPAWISYRLIENPLRHAKIFSRIPTTALATGLSLSLLGVIVGVGVTVATPSDDPPTDRVAQGAQVLGDKPRSSPAGVPVDKVSWFTPTVLGAKDDNANDATDSCDQPLLGTEPDSCTFGDPDGDVTVAMVGSSKTRQWIPVMNEIAKDRGWKVLSFTKSACEFTSAPTRDSGTDKVDGYPECDEWNTKVLDKLTTETKPDYVFTALDNIKVKQSSADEPRAEVDQIRFDGVNASWSALSDAGIKVIVMGATPRFAVNIPDCVATHGDDLTECAFPRSEGFSPDVLWGKTDAEEQVARVKGASYIDVSDYVCPSDTCAPVIGNVLVYYDKHHVTGTYVKSLRPQVERQLLAVM